MSAAAPLAVRPLDERVPALLQSRARGIFNPIPSPAIIEMVAYAGFDFVIIDNEHGNASFETTENMLRAARASGIPAIVRCLPHDIARTLDSGASAVQIPMVNTAQEARELVRRVRYPQPLSDGGVSEGRRGCAFSTRAAGYGAYGGPEHTRRSNDCVALIAQVETPEAIDHVAEIAAVPGLTSVFIGTNDLAHNMGCDNRYTDPRVEEAVRHALDVLAAAGVSAGIPAFDPAEEEKYAAWGARYFASGTTGIIMKALRSAASGPRPA